MSIEENKALVQRFYDAIQRRDFDTVGELCHPHFVFYTQVDTPHPGADGFIRPEKKNFDAFDDDVDLRNIGVVLEKNGKVVEVGAGAAVLGHPATAIAMLANMLGERGEEIPAGSVVLSGAITAAVLVEPGDNVTLRAQGLGAVSMLFV
ncbi:ester cyclase [Rhodocyclaceae bacterium SMB388]